MTDLDRMILAARQIGEVVGEDVSFGVACDGGQAYLETVDGIVGITTADALSIIRDRVWEAVRNFCNGWGRSCYWDREHGIQINGTWHPDLPSAVAAIHKHWTDNRKAAEEN